MSTFLICDKNLFYKFFFLLSLHHILIAGLLISSLPNNKILDWSKLKAFADDKPNVTQNLKFVLGRVENIVRKRENAGYSIFSFSPVFSKGFFSRVVKSRDFVEKG